MKQKERSMPTSTKSTRTAKSPGKTAKAVTSVKGVPDHVLHLDEEGYVDHELGVDENGYVDHVVEQPIVK